MNSLRPALNHARVRRAGAAAAATAVLAGLAVAGWAAASPGAASAASGAAAAAPQVPVLRWTSCDDGFQCATARVPLDYRQPRGTLISIAVIRHRATGPGRPAGSLFVNGGGPSAQIQGFVADYPAIPAVLRERFNLITFDPRGFGFSTPIQCFSSIEAEDTLLAPIESSPFPVGPAQTRVFERTYATFGAQCARRAGALLDHDTTADAARDMNLLREAVGASRLNYLGLSYGTGLGAVYANLFPATVGRMVLDGNLNPVAWTSGGTAPSLVREGVGPASAAEAHAFLSLCGEQAAAECAFSAGSPAATEAKFAALLGRLQAHPVTIAGQRFGYASVFAIVPPEVVSSWQSAAAQLQQLWLASSGTAAATARPASTSQAAAAAAASPYDGLEQSVAVVCSDSADPRHIGDYLAAARAGSRYGGFGAKVAWEEAACAYWPTATEQDRYTGPWHRRTAGTILVIGNTGDPVTPYQGSVAMAHDLARARLLTVDGFGHTEFFNPSECASDYEFSYLTTGKLPAPGTVCAQSVRPF
jgi:pimeloyl-ACP methyl ester carboxylesterase